MKELPRFIFTAATMISVAVLILTACTKEGPQGPAGPTGNNGKDANSNCVQCHNWSDSLVTKIFQYNASQHVTGSTVFEGKQVECAPCHTSQGFIECLSTGAFKTAAPYNDAAPVNCRTCHQIHKSYSSKDWALTTTAPFRAFYDSTIIIDLATNGGSSNLCGRCHQAMPAFPKLSNPTSMDDTLEPFTNLWGPHHGTQSLILAGKGAFEIGTAPFRSTDHKDTASCTTCHQAVAQGNYVGGHTLRMNNAKVGNNITACKQCHAGATSFDVNGKQTEIKVLYNNLKVKLAVANMLDTNTMLLNVKFYKQKQLAVYWNFMMVDADRSMGVHNYLYTHDMLQSGINYMNSIGF
ncbi:MAG: hypothetical protein M0P47_01870 [Bacteroidales bacterium]|nr:hypothetical protein [Bacteroidales bacterium]